MRNAKNGRLVETVWSLICFLLLVGARAESGASRRGVEFDLQGFLDREIQAGKTNIVVPPGSYRVKPRDRQHLRLRNLQGIQITADGVEMICTETTTALDISQCTNLTIRGLVIDYDPLPFTQGRITGFSADKKFAEIELFDGYPSAASAINFKYEIFRTDTRTLRCSDRYVKDIQVLDAKHLRLNTPNEQADSPEQVGDLIVLGSEFAPHGSTPHAVSCDHSSNVRFENLDLFASNCFGFIEDGCQGNTYYRCRIDRRPAADDLVKRADPRLRSLNADAYHSSEAVKGPAYIGCVAKFMGDDCVNIHGQYHLVLASTGAVMRIVEPGAISLRVGDKVEFLPVSGERPPNALVIAIDSAAPETGAEKSLIEKLNLLGGIKQNLTGSRAKCYRITLEKSVALQPGSLLANLNNLGNGFLVQGCDFGFNRSRGILIKAGSGQILDNTITQSWMPAVLVSPEYFWLEAGSSSDVKISGNKIIGCRQPAIEVVAYGGDGKPLASGAHRNISILDNQISESVSPCIRVTSTSGLKILNNRFPSLHEGTEKSFIALENCGLPEVQPSP